MTRASDNPYPSVLVTEGSVPTSPAAGKQRLYIDSADHKLKRVNSSGTVTVLDPSGTGMTNPMTTTGDVIYSSDNSGTPARLAAVAAGKVLKSAGTGTAPAWGYAAYHGCRAYNSTTQSIAAGADNALTMDTENFDTDGFHSTVTNTSRFTIPSGMDGYYLIEGGTFPASFASGKEAYISIWKNGTTMWRAEKTAGAAGIDTIQVSTVLQLAATDYIEFYGFNGDTSSRNFGHASAAHVQTWGSITLLGV